MRVSCLLLFSILLHTVASSQYRLKGFLGVEGGESFNYILEFTDSLGFIEGHSYTFLSEKREVKAKINGTLDRQRKLLIFRETELIYNKGFISNATICLIQANLKFVKDDADSAFKGAITTSDAGNVSCSRGSIIIPDIASVKKLFETPIAKIESVSEAHTSLKPKPARYLYDTAITQQRLSSHTPLTKITSGKETSIKWDSDSIVLYIWDSGKIDGDKISIRIGENYILQQYLLQGDRRKIKIPFLQKEIELVIEADNEGNESPNTATLLLMDGTIAHNILAYNTIGKSAFIRIRKNSLP